MPNKFDKYPQFHEDKLNWEGLIHDHHKSLLREEDDFDYLHEKKVVTSPASLEVKLVAPPRKKKKNATQSSATKMNETKETTDYDNRIVPLPNTKETTDYDNRIAPLPTPPTIKETADYDNRTAPLPTTPTTTATPSSIDNDDTYDNCISTGITLNNISPLTPIIEITDHEDTEYASIPEMVDMINKQC